LVVVHPLKPLSRGRVAALAVTAGIAALAVPAAANAAVTVTIDNTANTATFAGDQLDDNVTLTQDANGLLAQQVGQNLVTTFNGQTIQAAQANVIVKGGGGNDNINLSALNAANSVTIDGEDGDDIIVGSPIDDTINGGLGNDRITAGKNPGPAIEQIHGDAGNDVMIWNNGEGNDLNDGGDGVDETLIVEGTGADDNHVDPAPTAGQIRFSRAVAGQFTVDMTATTDKLSVTSFSGDDKLTTAPGIALNMNIDAGSGTDTISTGDGNDVVLGGDGNDTLNGAGGSDRLVGERGTDTMNGGAGDDTLVWNNGEGSDVMNGDDGVDRIENNLSGLDDISTLKPDGARIRYDRLNQVPFNLSIASAEVFELNELGGNDTLTTSPGVTIPVVADGGAGNDLFSVRDNSPTFVFGGSGADTATVDVADSVAGDVEAVDRPAVQPSPSAGVAKLVSAAKVKKGAVSLKLSCPAGTTGCKGSISLLTAKAFKLGKVKTQLSLGRATYSLSAGQTKTIKLKLASGTARLASKKKLATTARLSGTEKASKLTLKF
jgi:Ca2+-binding RTX toxin-like protein